ncbi:hypothetical protein MASR2M78_28410 [Treponema sp.]
MLSLKSALIATLVMALVIAFCRAVPFLFFRSKGGKLRSSFIQFVERSVPPVAMTTEPFLPLLAR